MTRVVAAAGRLLRGLLALAVLFGLLGGVPWLLVWFVGWPLPEHMPGLGELGTALASPLDDRKILNILAILAWALWLLFLRDVLVEAILDGPRGRDVRQRRPRAAAAALFLVDDGLAQLDALAADVHVVRPLDEGADVAVALAAKRAVGVAIAAGAARRPPPAPEPNNST